VTTNAQAEPDVTFGDLHALTLTSDRVAPRFDELQVQVTLADDLVRDVQPRAYRVLGCSATGPRS
jgi:hypothetical protein